MNDKVKHEIKTWGIFIAIIAIIVYPLTKLFVYLHIPYFIVAILAVVMGIFIMLGVEWFVKKYRI